MSTYTYTQFMLPKSVSCYKYNKLTSINKTRRKLCTIFLRMQPDLYCQQGENNNNCANEPTV